MSVSRPRFGIICRWPSHFFHGSGFLDCRRAYFIGCRFVAYWNHFPGFVPIGSQHNNNYIILQNCASGNCHSVIGSVPGGSVCRGRRSLLNILFARHNIIASGECPALLIQMGGVSEVSRGSMPVFVLLCNFLRALLRIRVGKTKINLQQPHSKGTRARSHDDLC